jgi:hypothetical protein
MHRIGDLMKELGFDPGGSIDAQKAFIKHLIRAADTTSSPARLASENSQNSVNLQKPKNSPAPASEIQLSFDPEILGVSKSR